MSSKQIENEHAVASLVSITPDAEKIMAYCARVSSPENQQKQEFEGLLKYCIRNEHWSVFEQANMCIEINTSRAISAQLLRHRSFSFQEFSQRYAKSTDMILYGGRRQDTKNRQQSIDDMAQDTKDWFADAQYDVWKLAFAKYEEALAKGIAKECARFLLPMGTATCLYMNGTIRSWIHYIQLRTGHGTQKEHMDIANMIKQIFVQQLPNVAKAMGW